MSRLRWSFLFRSFFGVRHGRRSHFSVLRRNPFSARFSIRGNPSRRNRGKAFSLYRDACACFGPRKCEASILLVSEKRTATHNCWAYVAGPAGDSAFVVEVTMELQGTAGRPMLTTLLYSGGGRTRCGCHALLWWHASWHRRALVAPIKGR